MKTEPHQLPCVYRETVNFLDRLAGEVREGKNVMLASQFARWLNFSGLVKIFRDNPSNQKHLEVDAGIVQRKINDLLFECGELFRGGRADPKYAASDIAEINRKLDSLLEMQSENRVTRADNGGLFSSELLLRLDRNPVTAKSCASR